MSDGEDSSFTSGMKAFRNNQYDEAIQHFTHAVREKSDIHKSFNALGVVYSRIGNTREAKLSFEKALVLDPHNPIYEKNLNTLNQRKKPEYTPEREKQRSPLPEKNYKFFLIIGISLIIVASVIFFLMFSLINFQSGGIFSGDGTGTGGLAQPLLRSLIPEERIPPTVSVTIQNKKIEYIFDRHQDLSQIKRIEAYVSIPDGTQSSFPVVTNPQKNLYYGIDDPFFGKEKRCVITGYYLDETAVVLSDSTLPPR